MPTVPTPFIGGSGGPPTGRPGKEPLEPPFVIDQEETEGDVEPTPTVAAEEGPPETGPTAPPAEEPVRTASPAAGTEPSSEGEALIDEVFREFPLPDEPEPAQEPVEPATASAAPVDTAPPRTDVGATELGEDEFPDFLTGSDSVGPDFEQAVEAQPDAGPAPWDEAVDEEEDDVTARARELLHGKFGDSIRKLAAELGSIDEETLSRAFAAGYLAAKREQQE